MGCIPVPKAVKYRRRDVPPAQRELGDRYAEPLGRYMAHCKGSLSVPVALLLGIERTLLRVCRSQCSLFSKLRDPGSARRVLFPLFLKAAVSNLFCYC